MNDLYKTKFKQKLQKLFGWKLKLPQMLQAISENLYL